MSDAIRVCETRIPTAEAELAADALWAAGAIAIEERDNGDGTVTLVSDVTSYGTQPAQVVELTDDGLNGWRPWARAWRAAPQSRLVVQPPWVEPVADARPDDVTLVIDPGHAFGGGSHPTTRLVLAELEHRVARGSRVLDVGSGSGVLAIAAARLGAEQVFAIDLDAEAIRATAANANANGVADRVTVSATPLAALDGERDLVVANISASAIVELAPALAYGARTIVLSGLLIADRERVLAAFPGRRCEVERNEDGWVVLVLV